MEFFLIYYAVQASLAPNLKVPYLLLPQEAKTNFFPEKISLSFQSLSSRRNVISARNGGQTREEASQVGKQMRKGRGGHILAPYTELLPSEMQVNSYQYGQWGANKEF